MVRMGRKGFNPTKKDATLAIDITPDVMYKTRNVPLQFRRVPQLGFGMQLKFEEISPAFTVSYRTAYAMSLNHEIILKQTVLSEITQADPEVR